MKTTRRTWFEMLAGLFSGFGLTWAKPAAAKLPPPTRFPAAEVSKASEAIARLAVASKEATHRLNELGVTVRVSGNAYIKEGKLMFTTPDGPFMTYELLNEEMLAALKKNPDADRFARAVSVREGEEAR